MLARNVIQSIDDDDGGQARRGEALPHLGDQQTELIAQFHQALSDGQRLSETLVFQVHDDVVQEVVRLSPTERPSAWDIGEIANRPDPVRGQQALGKQRALAASRRTKDRNISLANLGDGGCYQVDPELVSLVELGQREAVTMLGAECITPTQPGHDLFELPTVVSALIGSKPLKQGGEVFDPASIQCCSFGLPGGSAFSAGHEGQIPPRLKEGFI